MAKQQLPNHQLHKISHKASPSLNNSHKASPSLNNHKAKPLLIPNRNLSHHNSAVMPHFQMHFPHPQRLLRRKILTLYQRNQNIVYDQKYSTFNPLYLFLFSLYRSRKEKQDTNKRTHVFLLSAKCTKIFFRFCYLPTSCTVLNILLFYVNYSSNTGAVKTA